VRRHQLFGVDRYPADVREVILGEKGILQSLRPGGIVRISSNKKCDAREVFNLSMHLH